MVAVYGCFGLVIAKPIMVVGDCSPQGTQEQKGEKEGVKVPTSLSEAYLQ
jgi:hypothetical protein